MEWRSARASALEEFSRRSQRRHAESSFPSFQNKTGVLLALDSFTPLRITTTAKRTMHMAQLICSNGSPSALRTLRLCV